MKGIVLGGTASGVGKTVATLAIGKALEKAGHDVAFAKAGPDYIDPSHHAAIFDRPSRTVDTWMQGVGGVRRNFARCDGDLCVVEGMMGLYDGSVTSTAATAAALDLPVVLVIDASAGMQSVAASALGFREYASHADLPGTVEEAFESSADSGDVPLPRVDVAGIIAQRAHGGRHEDGIREALPDAIAYLGRIPPTEELEIPDRHLGLHMGDESPISQEALADVAAHIDADGLSEVAREAIRPAGGVESPRSGPSQSEGMTEDRPTIAVAQDAAFRFIYPATRERLARHADIVPFAPVEGDDLPACDGVYLPGGYPELHAEELASSPALETLGRRAPDGLPIVGECGGMMALCESLTTVDGETASMAGILPGSVRMHDRYQSLDHVELRAIRDAPTARVGETVRGHEFHYSSHDLESEVELGPDVRFAFEMDRGDGIDGSHDGLLEYETVGTYSHVHAASGAFDHLIESARAFAERE